MTSFEEYADGLTEIADADGVWQHTADFAYGLGFSSCSLTMAATDRTGMKSARLMSDLPAEFNRTYTEQGFVGRDPFLLFCCHSLTAKQVDTRDLSKYPGASLQHQMFLDYAADSGAAKGIGIPVRPFGESIFGGWVFSSNECDENYNRLAENHGREAHLAALLSYERMLAIDLEEKPTVHILSERERECLLWLCAGLRVSKIAEKLLISESAVNLYISNARRKLGAKTREQAVARAIVNGEISL